MYVFFPFIFSFIMIRTYEISLYLLICIFSIQIIVTNSRTSTLWKLNPESGKIISLTSNNNLYKHVNILIIII